MSRTNFDEPHGEPSLADLLFQAGSEYRKRQQTRLQAAQVIARWLARKMEDRTIHEPTGRSHRDAAQVVCKGLRQAIIFGVYPSDKMLTPLEIRELNVQLKGQGKNEPAKFVLVLKVREGITDNDLLNSSVDETLIQLCVVDTYTESHPNRIPDIRRLSLRDPCLGQFPDIPLPESL